MRDSIRKILLVGIGAAGTTHLRVIEQIPALAVIAAVDIDTSLSAVFRGNALPQYKSIFDASRKYDPDIVVVATSTPAHFQVCRDVMECFPRATILVEKPAADNLGAAQWLLGENSGRPSVSVALHMAFAPEVIWGEGLARARASELGVPILIGSWSADPYLKNLRSAESRLGNSWIDSGINALSVIERFVKVVERVSLRRLGDAPQSIFEGIFKCEIGDNSVEATILTSWKAAGSTRSTRIRYSSGAELVLDHHAVAGYLTENGKIREMFGSDGSVPRRESHYRAMYKWWQVDDRPIFSATTSLRLHNLLLKSVDCI